MSNTADETKNTDVPVWKWIFALLVVAAIWGASGYAVHKLADTEPTQDKATPGVLGPRGTFGDMFGAVNALFSGLAFATLIYTVMLQRHELKLQRQELEETRKELAGQRKQMEAQANTFRKQAFEDTFFKLLDLQRKLASEAELIDSTTTKGRDCFLDFRRVLIDFYESQSIPTFNQKAKHKPSYELFTTICKKEINGNHARYLPRYFRSLSFFLDFILRSEISGKDFYISFVRNQLSTEELFTVFYICFKENDEKKDISKFRESNFFKEIPLSVLLDESHISILNPTT